MDQDLGAQATDRQSSVIMTQTFATLIAIPLSILATWGMGNAEPWHWRDMFALIPLAAAFVFLWMGLLRSLGDGPYRQYRSYVLIGGILIAAYVVATLVFDFWLRHKTNTFVPWNAPSPWQVVDLQMQPADQ